MLIHKWIEFIYKNEKLTYVYIVNATMRKICSTMAFPSVFRETIKMFHVKLLCFIRSIILSRSVCRCIAQFELFLFSSMSYCYLCSK